MNGSDSMAKIREFHLRQQAINARIVDNSRRLIPLLKDAGHPHSAQELDILFFELDACKQEQNAFIENNVDSVVSGLIDSMTRPPR